MPTSPANRRRTRPSVDARTFGKFLCVGGKLVAENPSPRGEVALRRAFGRVGRHSFDALTYRAPKGAPGWIDQDRCDWTIVVGDRIRRLRRDRKLTLVELSGRTERPRGRPFSPGYISRIERGWANAPLSSYLTLAAALDAG